jgi:hydroxylamine reductase
LSIIEGFIKNTILPITGLNLLQNSERAMQNDSYSLAVIALKLKEVFGLEDINDLPVSYDIAWYEQKAVAVLLALLYLGVKGIRLGPTLPAFISPTVLKVLVEKFDIKPIGEVKADVEAMMTGR